MFCWQFKVEGVTETNAPTVQVIKQHRIFFSESNGLMTRITNEYVQEEEKSIKNVTLCTMKTVPRTRTLVYYHYGKG